jgi:hypothetical protein
MRMKSTSFPFHQILVQIDELAMSNVLTISGVLWALLVVVVIIDFLFTAVTKNTHNTAAIVKGLDITSIGRRRVHANALCTCATYL